MELSEQRLDDLDPHVAVPSYDRTRLAPSIVHIGLGGFHRAHLATYIDELAAVGHTEWGIVGAGVLPGDVEMDRALRAQDFLYTLLVRGTEGERARVVGSIVDYVHAHPDVTPLVERIADPATRIVSLTVTEAGYPIDDDTGTYDAASPNAAPGSAFGAIVAGLARRRDEGSGPVTVLSCDNVIGNGAIARTSVLGVAGDDPDLAAWIDEHVTFPNSMVDRITPVTTAADRAHLVEAFGIRDRWPVMTEPFRQWVVEDRFAAGRPPIEETDVIVVDDVEPYELFKLRLLNAGHSCLAYLARVAEIEYVDEVLAEGRFAGFLWRFLDEEAGPTVPATPGIDLEDYKASLVERFANPAIGDQVQRLCLDGSAKFPKFLVPTIRHNLATAGPIAMSTLALAGWCQYLVGRTDSGASIEHASDPGLDVARRHAAASRDDPVAFLRFESVFGDEVPASPRFVATFEQAVRDLRNHGVRSTLDMWVAKKAGAVDA